MEIIINDTSMHHENRKKWYFGLMGRKFDVIEFGDRFKVITGKSTGLFIQKYHADLVKPRAIRSSYLRIGNRLSRSQIRTNSDDFKRGSS